MGHGLHGDRSSLHCPHVTGLRKVAHGAGAHGVTTTTLAAFLQLGCEHAHVEECVCAYVFVCVCVVVCVSVCV